MLLCSTCVNISLTVVYCRQGRSSLIKYKANHKVRKSACAYLLYNQYLAELKGLVSTEKNDLKAVMVPLDMS
jgi:hypothetical protein